MGQRGRFHHRAAVAEALEPRRMLALSLLGDFNAGTPTSNAFAPVAVGSVGYFSADDGVHGGELWKTDGTVAGTALVKDINPGSASSGKQDGNQAVIQGLINVGGKLFFPANDGVNGTELWTSDGTEAGTMMVKNIAGGSSSSSPQFITDLNGIAIFYAPAWGIYRSDGTAAGTTQIASLQAGGFARIGEYLYFIGGGLGGPQTSMYRTDGTAAGTVFVNNFSLVTPSTLTALNGKLYFAAQAFGDGTGIEPYVSDGTPAGTDRLGDIQFGVGNSSPSNFFTMGGEIYFTAYANPSGNRWLCRSDGTPDSAVALAEIGTQPSGFTVYNNAVYFSGRDAASGTELWRSDGTAAGTGVFIDLWPGTSSGLPGAFQLFNGRLFFGAYTESEGWEMRSTDGTVAEAVLLKDVAPGPAGSRGFTSTAPQTGILNGRMYFRATDIVHGQELWSTDGTAGGTTMLKDIHAASTNNLNPGALVAGPNWYHYFTANDTEHGTELWKTDGTAGGTSMVKDIYPGSHLDGSIAGSSSPGTLAYINGTLVFAATDPIGGTELWRSDGTEGGTSRVKDIWPGSNSAILVKTLVKVGQRVFFVASDSSSIGFELWTSDGTEAGTQLVKDVNAGTGHMSTTINGMELNGKLVFLGPSNVVWISDGTEAGTTILKDGFIPPPPNSMPLNWTVFNGKLYFTQSTTAAGQELWVTDGTTGGTTVADLWPGNGSSNPMQLVATATDLYFAANDNSGNGVELWRLNRFTGALTRVSTLTFDVQQIMASGRGGVVFRTAGSELYHAITAVTTLKNSGFSTSPNLLGSANGLDYFAAGTTAAGTELWMTDGTAAGTVQVQDVVAGTGSSTPQNLGVINGNVFVSMTTPTTGREWFSMPAFAHLNPDGSLTLNGTESSDVFELREFFGEIQAKLFGATLRFDLDDFTGVVHLNGGTGNDDLQLNTGTYHFHEDLSITTPRLTVRTEQGSESTFHAPQHFDFLEVAGLIHMADGEGGNNFLVIKQLDLFPTPQFGQLDLGDNAMIYDYAGSTPYPTVNGHVVNGRNNGAWDGIFGINSWTAQGSGGMRGLGIGEASAILGFSGSQTADYRGHAVDATTIIIKYTYTGDANLDGEINGDDYFIIDSHVNQSGVGIGYAKGDFDYDGDVDGDDYFWIDSNYPAQGGVIL